MLIYATGTSGTLGKHLSTDVHPLDFRLEHMTNDLFEVNLHPFQLIHLAGVVGGGVVNDDPEYSFNINVTKTLELAERANTNGLERFIYISSSHVYGWSEKDLTEDDATNPLSLYAEQKVEAEMTLSSYFSTEPEKLLILRVFSVLDFGTAPISLGGAVDRIVTGKNSKKIECSSDLRDFMTPTSIAGVVMDLATKPRISGTFNICTSKQMTVKDAAGSLLRSKNILTYQGYSSSPRIVGSNKKLLSIIPDHNFVWPYP
jgi:nucleoside-diphosphate-sugar epimerase